ncbi:MAG: DUF1501 domain-containing protein [Acidobacteria bacterium]|nr:DUF1501 domain-containing protein [Acidobacteriota bacterium]
MNSIRKNCSEHLPFTRRHFLFGTATAGLLGAHADAQVTVASNAAIRNSAKSCIFVNLNGAPSHLDTFDLKDAAWNPRDANIRDYPGGVRMSMRYFPRLSTMTNDLLVLRSCASWEAAHERGQFYMQTARSQNPALASEIPHIGAVIAREKGANGLIPPFLSFNQSNLQGATFLGGLYMPMMTPANSGGIGTLMHNFFGNAQQSQQRFERRFSLLKELDSALREVPPNEAMAAYGSYYDRAKAMMYNSAVDSVFRFSTQDQNRYGNTSIGRSLIIARNAIRAKNGATFINVTQGGWDTHVGQFDPSTTPNIYTLTNELDRAVSNLVDDLKASGDFNSTLIIMMGEFGRTPGVLNSRAGRDHYRDVMSVAMMGGGVKGGRVIGASDANGARITDFGWSQQRPIYVEDITATIYSALGIDWTKSIDDTPSKRRFYYVPGATDGSYQPVEEVFG